MQGLSNFLTRPVQLDVPSKPLTIRHVWLRLFIGFMVFQLLIVGFGIYLNVSGSILSADAVKKLGAMRQMFLTISTMGVIASLMIARAKMTSESIKSVEDLFKSTVLTLAVGEITLLITAVGLAKLFLTQFLVAAALVFIVHLAIVLPAGLRLLAQPAQKVENIRNKFEL